eukprot:MONOS_658.1-p1 / transcript=MONOS_658.1 / gene=MONOS_658 / organism=Monocercomonoides_exilis_PA203 / gene_product=unspecified product / transcript_product=unspecified product / location=Mono_scaffold00011:47379-47660(+) / protein_length=74 / sequence_SO=supercontig / SO=protein_coding / is_pseudo=false
MFFVLLSVIAALKAQNFAGFDDEYDYYGYDDYEYDSMYYDDEYEYEEDDEIEDELDGASVKCQLCMHKMPRTC